MKFNYVLNWDDKCDYKPREVAVDIEGIDANDHIIKRITKTKTFYEIELLNYLLVRAPKGGVYIDIGANIGNHAVYFGKFLASHVVCIEPSPKIAKLLKRNLTENQVDNHVIVGCALGSVGGEGRMLYPDNDNIGMTKVVSNTGGGNGEMVEIRTLDEVFESLNMSEQISLIKIDVEGMELDVLKGAVGLLKAHQPQLVIEAATQKEQESIFEYLSPLGYVPCAQFCQTPTFHMIIPNVHKLRKTTLFYKFVRVARKVQRLFA